MEELKLKRGIIVGVLTSNEELFNYEMKELKLLAEACDIEIISSLYQSLDHPNNSYYLGSGKLIELADLVENNKIDTVIFNDELSPSTLSNIQDKIDCEILDRTNLILEIFDRRAKTKEAALQVELAKLSYLLPRLVGARTNMSRIGGGGTGAGGARRGSGETALEMDKRQIKDKITAIKEELYSITKARSTTRTLRKKQETPVIAFVGYTNAGKSSTINSILERTLSKEEKNVFVKDMLFATLETSSRGIKLPNNHEFIITDTVGFVHKLPHHLVESFKSTLEEIKEANLIIHLVDASNPYLDLQIETTEKVLESLGAKDIPVIYVYNKIDKVREMNLLVLNKEPSLKISNTTGEGIEELIDLIDKTIYNSQITCKLLIPYTMGKIINVLNVHATIHSTSYIDEGSLVTVTLSNHLYSLYKEYEIK